MEVVQQEDIHLCWGQPNQDGPLHHQADRFHLVSANPRGNETCLTTSEGYRSKCIEGQTFITYLRFTNLNSP